MGRPKKEYILGALQWRLNDQGTIGSWKLSLNGTLYEGTGAEGLVFKSTWLGKKTITARIITHDVKTLHWLIQDYAAGNCSLDHKGNCLTLHRVRSKKNDELKSDELIGQTMFSDIKAYTGSRTPKDVTVEWLLDKIRPYVPEKLSTMKNSTAAQCRYRYASVLTAGDGKGVKYFQRDVRSWKLQGEELAFLWHFQHGGMCWANPAYLNQEFVNCFHIDYTSQYPYLLATQKFPVSAGYKVYLSSRKHLERLIRTGNAVIFKAIFKNIEISQDIAWLKPEHATGEYLDSNGKLVFAEECSVFISSETWKRLERSYKYEDVIFCYAWCYKLGRLKPEYVNLLLDDYAKKTEFKGVPEKQAEYFESKIMINNQAGAFQMCPVPDIPKPERKKYSFRAAELQEKLDKGYNRVNFKQSSGEGGRYWHFPQGLWLTELGFCCVLDILLDNPDKALYCDTDGIVLKEAIDISPLNRQITMETLQAAYELNIPKSKFVPYTAQIVGKRREAKPLGQIEADTYSRFKMLGQKRYIYEQGGVIQLSHSGVFIPESFDKLLESGDPIANYTDDFSGVRAPIIDKLEDDRGKYVVIREAPTDDILSIINQLAS